MEEQSSLYQNADDSVLKSSQTMPENLKRDKVLVLISGVLIHLVLGTFYLWGTVSIYVASYLNHFDSSVTVEMLSSVFPFAGLGINIGLLFGLQIAERVGYRLVAIVGVTLMAVGTFCASFLTSYFAFVTVYGILVGICIGVVYIIPVVCGWKYYPQRKGLVSGLTIGAFGFGSFIFNFVALQIVNPNDENPTNVVNGAKYFNSDVYNRVPTMFRILGGCYLALGLAGAVLLRAPKTKKVAANLEDSSDRDLLLPSASQPGCQSVKEGILSFTFWNLLILVIFGSFFGMFMAVNYKVYALNQISDDAFLTLVGSLGSVSNGTTRALWALLFDKFGFKRVYFILITIQIIMAGTLSLISSSKPLYLIWYMLIMSCEGGHFSLLPSVSAKVFGLKFGPKIYGLLFWGFAISNFMGFFITKYALDSIGWKSVFYMATGFSALALVMNVLFREKFRKKKQVSS